MFIWFLDHIFWRYVSRSRKARSERKIRLSKLNRWDFWVLDFECVSWEPGARSWPLRPTWGWDSLRNGWSSYVATGCYRKITGERKSQLVRQTSLLSHLRHWHSRPSLQQPSLWSVSSYQHQDKNLHQQKDHDLLKIMTYSDDDLHVLAIKYFLIKYVWFF